jgi:hypothetical protein
MCVAHLSHPLRIHFLVRVGSCPAQGDFSALVVALGTHVLGVVLTVDMATCCILFRKRFC